MGLSIQYILLSLSSLKDSLLTILFTLLINSGAIACLAAFFKDLISVFKDPDF